MKKQVTFLLIVIAFAINVNAAVVYVTVSGAGLMDGSSWLNAYNGSQLKTQIDVAPSGTDFWVAAGTYYPGTSGSTTARFELRSGVNIYGGFAGSEILLNQRNPTLNQTILSGDLDQSNSINGNDAINVVHSSGADGTALIDGFTIRGGTSNGSFISTLWGGGVCVELYWNSTNIPLIQNCIIENNNGGIGVINWYGYTSCDPKFYNCIVRNNTNEGIAVFASNATAYPVFENVLVYGNSGYVGIRNQGGNSTYINCSFYNNIGSYQNFSNMGGSVVINNSIVQGGLGGSFTGNNNITDGAISGINNNNVSPGFVNAAVSNFHLIPCSPAINAGDNSALSLSNTVDLDGSGRIFQTTVDLGPYELSSFGSSISAGSNVAICNGASTTLTATGGTVYQWSPAPLPLDVAPTASLAVGLRKLKSSYTGFALQLRRSSDNALMNFGFVGNDLDAAAIATWLGVNSGYCTMLYDQSGSGHNMTQANTGNQPLFVASGINGKPMLHFSTSMRMTNSTNFPSPYTIVYGARQNASSRQRVLSSLSNNWLLGWWAGKKGQAFYEGWVSNNGNGPSADNNSYVYSGASNGSSSQIYENGTLLFSNGNGVTGPNGIEMNGLNNGSEMSDCDFLDVIVFTSVLTTNNRSFVEKSIGSYYNISTTGSYSLSQISVSPSTTTTYTVTGTENNGCTSTSTVLVTVNAPIITCPGNVTANQATGTCAEIVNYPAATATGDAPISITYSQNSGTSFNVGTTVVTATATDVNGCTSSCTFNVTVYDITAPQISCPNDITVLNNPVVTYAVSATDDCSQPVTITQTAGLASGAIFPVGVTTNIFVATDASGNTSGCSFTVTFNDNQPPVIQCPVNLTVNNNPGNCNAIVSYALPIVSDNSCLPPVSLPGFNYLGTYGGHTYFVSTVTATWTSANITANALGGKLISLNTAGENAFLASVSGGNSFWVGGFQNHSNPNYSENSGGWEWVDGTQMTYTSWAGGEPNGGTGEDHLQFYSGGSWNDLNFSGTLKYVVEMACGITPILASGPASGGTFNLGATTVTYAATDASGNSSDCSFQITVVDSEAPTISCAGLDITVNADPGICTGTVVLGLATASDNCISVAIANDHPSTTYNAGTTVVTWTATDAAGNTSKCTSTVFVYEPTPPVITCPASVTVNNTPGQCGAFVNIAATATDNCTNPLVVYPYTKTFNYNGTIQTFTVPAGITNLSINTIGAAGGSSGYGHGGYGTSMKGDFSVTPGEVLYFLIGGQGQNYGGGGGTYVSRDPALLTNLLIASGGGGGSGSGSYGHASTGNNGMSSYYGASGGTAGNGGGSYDGGGGAGWLGNGGGSCGGLRPANGGNGGTGCGGGNGGFGGGGSGGNAAGGGGGYSGGGAGYWDYYYGTPYSGGGGGSFNSGSNQINLAQIGTGNGQVLITYGTPFPYVDVSSGVQPGDLFPVGTTTNTWIATDASGNTASCSATITVIDNEAPVIYCPANMTVNNTPGQCSAIVNYPIPLVGDNCCPLPTSLSGYTYLGAYSGHSYFLSNNTLNWTDSRNAAIALGGQLASINSSGENAFLASVVGGNAPSIGGFQNHLNPNYSEPSGGWEWLDGSPFSFTSWGGGEPNNSGGEDYIQISSNGFWNDLCNCANKYIVEFSCGLTPTLVSGPVSGSTFPVGTTTISYMATDGAGFTSACSFTITVVDNEAPVISNCGLAQSAFTDGNCQAAMPDFTAGMVVSDNCTAVNLLAITQSPPASTLKERGVYIITLTVTDAAGNSSTCYQTFSVIDNVPPVINCPALITVNTEPNLCEAIVNFSTPGLTDNCPALVVQVDETYNYTGSVQTFTAQYNGNYLIEAWGAKGGDITSYYPIEGGLGGYASGWVTLNIGQTINIYVGEKGQDRLGNHPYSTCTYTPGGWNGGGANRSAGTGTPGGGASDVRINGTALSDRIIVAGGGGGGGWTFAKGGAGGGLTGLNGTQSNQSGIGAFGGTQFAGGSQGGNSGPCGKSSGSLGQGGDGSGNSAGGGGGGGGYYGGGGGGYSDGGGGGSSYIGGVTGGSTIPGIRNGDGQIKITFSINVESTINQSGGLASGSSFPVGNSTVTWNATDASGNTTGCTQTITVIDNEAPVITNCPTDINGCNHVINYTESATATDNCGVQSIAYSHPSGSTFPDGTTVVTVTATDVHGNTSTCTFNVTVGIAISANVSNVKCRGTATGIIDLTAESGPNPMTYLWNNGSTNQDLNSLVAGTYTVTVTNSINCTKTATFTITQAATLLSINVTKTNVRCGGKCTGVAQMLPVGGSGVYSYLWNGGSTNDTRSGLCAGTYTCAITDSYGCTKTKTVVITQNTPLTLSATPITNTSAVANPGGGVPGYLFSWNTTPVQTTQTATGLIVSHTYKVKVTDSKGCTTAFTFVMTNPPVKPSGTTLVTEQESGLNLYPNPTTGMVTLSISSCISCNFKLTLYDALGKDVFTDERKIEDNSTTLDFSELAKGIYSLHVDDGNINKVMKVVIQ